MQELSDNLKGQVCAANRLAAAGLDKILLEYDIKYKRRANGVYEINCAYCNDHKFNCSIITKKQNNMHYFTPFYKCWCCKSELTAGRSITALIAKIRHVELPAAISIINGITK